MESDTGDADLERDNPVLFYLNPDETDKKYYTVVLGWSGIVRLMFGKYYHQYWAMDYDKYVVNLKKYLKN